MDWQLAVGCAAAGAALLLFISIEFSAEDEPLPPPRQDCIARGGKDAWTVSEGRERT